MSCTHINDGARKKSYMNAISIFTIVRVMVVAVCDAQYATRLPINWLNALIICAAADILFSPAALSTAILYISMIYTSAGPRVTCASLYGTYASSIK